MSLQACANLVHAADPSRWKAVMSAPLAARDLMLPIYAANVEISRAPWVTKEPMIALMRLQWWRDALDELAAGTPRRHEVVDALAVLPATALAPLHSTIDARHRDVEKEPFGSADDLLSYARDTTYGPIASAYFALGGPVDHAPLLLDAATALGTSRVLQAYVDLKASTWRIFDPSWTDAATADVAARALDCLRRATPLFQTKSLAASALIETAGTARFLNHIRARPGRVKDGTVAAFPIRTVLSRVVLARRAR